MAGGKDTGGKKPYDRFYVASLARECTDKAVKLLVDVVNDTTQKMADRIRAAETLLDRGWGKAPQEIKLGNADDESKGLNLIVTIVDPKSGTAAAGGQSKEPRASDPGTTGEDNKPAT